MSDTPDPWNIAGIIGGAATLLVTIGHAARWLFTRQDRREAALDKKEAELVARLEKRVEALEKDNRQIWLALSYVVPALYAHDPHSPALKAAQLILGDAMPIPPDMTATLEKIP